MITFYEYLAEEESNGDIKHDIYFRINTGVLVRKGSYLYNRTTVLTTLDKEIGKLSMTGQKYKPEDPTILERLGSPYGDFGKSLRFSLLELLQNETTKKSLKKIDNSSFYNVIQKENQDGEFTSFYNCPIPSLPCEEKYINDLMTTIKMAYYGNLSDDSLLYNDTQLDSLRDKNSLDYDEENKEEPEEEQKTENPYQEVPTNTSNPIGLKTQNYAYNGWIQFGKRQTKTDVIWMILCSLFNENPEFSEFNNLKFVKSVKHYNPNKANNVILTIDDKIKRHILSNLEKNSDSDEGSKFKSLIKYLTQGNKDLTDVLNNLKTKDIIETRYMLEIFSGTDLGMNSVTVSRKLKNFEKFYNYCKNPETKLTIGDIEISKSDVQLKSEIW